MLHLGRRLYDSNLVKLQLVIIILACFQTKYRLLTVVGIYSATGKVAFAVDSVVLYIKQICNLTGIILGEGDFLFALYTPTTVDDGKI